MKKLLSLAATALCSALCLSAAAQTAPPASGSTPMQEGTMTSTTMKHGKMHQRKMGKTHKDKMKDGLDKSKMADDKMKTKM